MCRTNIIIDYYSRLFVFITREFMTGIIIISRNAPKTIFDIYTELGRHQITVSEKGQILYFRCNNNYANFDLGVPQNQKQVSEQQLRTATWVIVVGHCSNPSNKNNRSARGGDIEMHIKI